MRNKTVYIYLVDDEISKAEIKTRLVYLKAFFTGCDFKTLRPGKTVTVNDPEEGTKKVQLPEAFM